MSEGQITLVRRGFENNEYGVAVPTEQLSLIYCSIDSVTQSEFFAAGQNGIKASLKAVIFAPEYAKQQTVEYEGKRYKVYRTYLADEDRLELYLGEAVGEQ